MALRRIQNECKAFEAGGGTAQQRRGKTNVPGKRDFVNAKERRRKGGNDLELKRAPRAD